MQTVNVIAPAKLNLSLDVLGLLDNGYHSLDMLMQTVDIYEKISITKSEDLTLRLPNSTVPINEKNTAIKAAIAFFKEVGLLSGAKIIIEKNIPVRAGMAGGSADAAGVLVGLNALYNAKLTLGELCAIGASIGADVPFALMGGTCRVQGVGDFLKPLPPLVPCYFVIAMPSDGVSTPVAFAAYDEQGSSVHPDCDMQERAIRAGQLERICATTGNALEETSGTHETADIKKTLLKHGAYTALMTGSGAATYGIFAKDDLQKAQNAVTALQKNYKQVYLAKPVSGGAKVVHHI